jgi:hypothetical protein
MEIEFIFLLGSGCRGSESFSLKNEIFKTQEIKNLKSFLSVPQEAAPPTAPPTRAFPTKTAPPTTIGAILALGADSVEKESSVEMTLSF